MGLWSKGSAAGRRPDSREVWETLAGERPLGTSGRARAGGRRPSSFRGPGCGHFPAEAAARSPGSGRLKETIRNKHMEKCTHPEFRQTGFHRLACVTCIENDPRCTPGQVKQSLYQVPTLMAVPWLSPLLPLPQCLLSQG